MSQKTQGDDENLHIAAQGAHLVAPDGKHEVATGKRARFAHEYLKDRNGTQAALRAGYPPGSAASQASRLLRDPRVRAIIDAGEQQVQAKAGITAEMILEELRSIACADLAEAYDEDGRLKPIREMPLDVRKAIAAVEETDSGGRKLRRWDKVKALELLGKHVGAWKDRLQLEGEGGGPVVVEVVNFADKKEG